MKNQVYYRTEANQDLQKLKDVINLNIDVAGVEWQLFIMEDGTLNVTAYSHKNLPIDLEADGTLRAIQA